MMDVLDTPLNSAHQQGRKAERYLAAGKYDEAIRCHQAAADLLGEALMTTSVKEALESLNLQQQHHLRQKDIVRLKQRQAEMHETQTLTTTRESLESVRWSKDFPHGVTSEDMIDVVDNGGLRRTIRECDSLLTFLNDRYSMEYRSIASPSSSSTNDTRIPKDDAVIIEELRTHNDALRHHVIDLLHDRETQDKDLRHYKSENARLHARLRELEKMNRSKMSESYDSELEYQMTRTMGLNLDDPTVLDLPPLEMPKFDLDILKTSDSSGIGGPGLSD